MNETITALVFGGGASVFGGLIAPKVYKFFGWKHNHRLWENFVTPKSNTDKQSNE